MNERRRRYPIGAEVDGEGTTFRVWAPGKQRLDVVLESDGRVVPLERDGDEHFAGHVEGVGHGARYRLRIGGDAVLPDPASRSQPEGPHGPSEVIDPHRYAWRDHGWRGRTLREAVMYELHVGTFTREGTWRAAAEHLDRLADVGITVVEMLPVCEFAGEFGWGYDGVSLFAPYHRYGTPDDLRRFVDRAHAVGIAVVLDIVYNHLGPDGNYLRTFAPTFESDRYETDWGASPRFDGPGSEPVREFVLSNARYWIEELHFDGLRLDATQDIHDFDGGEHIIAAIARTVREAAGGRATLVIAENEPQRMDLVRSPEHDGMGLDALWNDDFHHSAVAALTGQSEAYYRDYRGTAQELASALAHGFLYQGQRYAWQSKRRGTPTFGADPSVFVTYLQNHDQVANSFDGQRLHTLACPARYRALLALLLLGPGTPLLFQGEDFLASAPFLYFADHRPEIAPSVRAGRAEFLSQFPSLATPEARARLADPGDAETFARSVLDHAERAANAAHVALVRRLLELRREDPTLSARARRGHAASSFAGETIALRYFGEVPESDRLVIVNLGETRHLESVSDPLCAPPLGHRWRTELVSEAPAWGGRGTVDLEHDDGWHLTANTTALLFPERDPTPRFGPPTKKPKHHTESGR